jgi:hypothetical protein
MEVTLDHVPWRTMLTSMFIFENIVSECQIYLIMSRELQAMILSFWHMGIIFDCTKMSVFRFSFSKKL